MKSYILTVISLPSLSAVLPDVWGVNECFDFHYNFLSCCLQSQEPGFDHHASLQCWQEPDGYERCCTKPPLMTKYEIKWLTDLKRGDDLSCGCTFDALTDKNHPPSELVKFGVNHPMCKLRTSGYYGADMNGQMLSSLFPLTHYHQKYCPIGTLTAITHLMSFTLAAKNIATFAPMYHYLNQAFGILFQEFELMDLMDSDWPLFGALKDVTRVMMGHLSIPEVKQLYPFIPSQGEICTKGPHAMERQFHMWAWENAHRSTLSPPWLPLEFIELGGSETTRQCSNNTLWLCCRVDDQQLIPACCFSTVVAHVAASRGMLQDNLFSLPTLRFRGHQLHIAHQMMTYVIDSLFNHANRGVGWLDVLMAPEGWPMYYHVWSNSNFNPVHHVKLQNNIMRLHKPLREPFISTDRKIALTLSAWYEMRANIVRAERTVLCVNQAFLSLMEGLAHYCYVESATTTDTTTTKNKVGCKERPFSIIELGAHFGDCSLWAGHAMAASDLEWDILAVEMQKDAALGFRRAVDYNDFENEIHVIQKAVSNVSGEKLRMTMVEGQQAMARTLDNSESWDEEYQHFLTESPVTLRMDDKVRDFVDVLKVSIHGAEIVAMQGLRKTLEKQRIGVMFFEPGMVTERQNSRTIDTGIDFVEYLIDFGYECIHSMASLVLGLEQSHYINVTNVKNDPDLRSWYADFMLHKTRDPDLHQSLSCVLDQYSANHLVETDLRSRIFLLRKLYFMDVIRGKKYEVDSVSLQMFAEKHTELKTYGPDDNFGHWEHLQVDTNKFHDVF